MSLEYIYIYMYIYHKFDLPRYALPEIGQYYKLLCFCHTYVIAAYQMMFHSYHPFISLPKSSLGQTKHTCCYLSSLLQSIAVASICQSPAPLFPNKWITPGTNFYLFFYLILFNSLLL